MNKEFHQGNRKELYARLEPGSLLLLFCGHAPRKTGDEDYPFFADRSFVYYTGIEQQDSIFAAIVDESGAKEMLFMLPPDAHAERWTGRRLKADEAAEISGVADFRYLQSFQMFLDTQLALGKVKNVYLDFDKKQPFEQPLRRPFTLAEEIRREYPYVTLLNVHNYIRDQRTIKKPCEIEATRKAELITRDGILAMMHAAKDGIYEYQLKAEYDYALAQHGVLSPGFPSIVSAGTNNFCIHYYSYRGQAHDGDMVLNDVGAIWDHMITDVSRGWPLNGKFSDKQKALYNCSYNTSNHMFDILKPGIEMSFVDQEIRRYNFEQLKSIGVCDKFENVGTYIWHGGAHHVGFDVHDEVEVNGGKRLLEPGMIFCIDVGIYHEEWGIGFRLEDNCLITENGCECLSACTPRSIEDIEENMRKK